MSARQNATTTLVSLCTDKCNEALANAFKEYWFKEYWRRERVKERSIADMASESEADKTGLAICFSFLR